MFRRLKAPRSYRRQDRSASAHNTRMRTPIPIRKASDYTDRHITFEVGSIQILVPSSMPGLCVILIKSAMAQAAQNCTQACLSNVKEMEIVECDS